MFKASVKQRGSRVYPKELCGLNKSCTGCRSGVVAPVLTALSRMLPLNAAPLSHAWVGARPADFGSTWRQPVGESDALQRSNSGAPPCCLKARTFSSPNSHSIHEDDVRAVHPPQAYASKPGAFHKPFQPNRHEHFQNSIPKPIKPKPETQTLSPKPLTDKPGPERDLWQQQRGQRGLQGWQALPGTRTVQHRGLIYVYSRAWGGIRWNMEVYGFLISINESCGDVLNSRKGAGEAWCLASVLAGQESDSPRAGRLG